MGPAPRTVRWPLPPPGWRGAFPSLWGLFLNSLFALMFQRVPRAGSPQEPLSAGLGLAEPFPGPHLHPTPLSEGRYLFRCHRWTPVHWKFPVGGRTQWVRQTRAGRPRRPALGVSPGPEGPPLLLTTGRDRTVRKAPKCHSPSHQCPPQSPPPAKWAGGTCQGLILSGPVSLCVEWVTVTPSWGFVRRNHLTFAPSLEHARPTGRASRV